MPLDVQVRGANKLREMAIQLRKADKEYLGRELAKAIKQAAEPTLADLRAAARNIRTSGVRRKAPLVWHPELSRGLEHPELVHPFTKAMPPKGTRAKIADSVTASVSVTSDNPRVQFKTGRGLDDNLRNMPRKFDQTEFRHPVMGNRDVWVSQRSNPWFFEPIRRRLRTFRAAMNQALDATREMLERG